METLFFCKSVNLPRTWGLRYLEFSGKREVDHMTRNKLEVFLDIQISVKYKDRERKMA